MISNIVYGVNWRLNCVKSFYFCCIFYIFLIVNGIYVDKVRLFELERIFNSIVE